MTWQQAATVKIGNKRRHKSRQNRHSGERPLPKNTETYMISRGEDAEGENKFPVQQERRQQTAARAQRKGKPKLPETEIEQEAEEDD